MNGAPRDDGPRVDDSSSPQPLALAHPDTAAPRAADTAHAARLAEGARAHRAAAAAVDARVRRELRAARAQDGLAALAAGGAWCLSVLPGTGLLCAGGSTRGCPARRPRPDAPKGPPRRTGSRALAAAAALCLSVLPWTRLLMRRRLDAEIARLADEADAARATQEVSAAQEASAKWLVDQWGVYNLGRGVPVLVAGVIGVFSLVL
ncbi:predicted protein [Verticillium alfalfae VaMs.102]|uniref:Predicted protein n=1 Tax=Verticillium alfalfae (strain VaMs.102 / ATCC MYA-4576 / FGSC 10136) TaxID=526221 RepID=C9SS98_VERA1|nr:predicted protein [Verticillium alfalfae VaMs.102]EEY21663.1 predicted protein [Verticillium alfalfae VaMs.102]